MKLAMRIVLAVIGSFALVAAGCSSSTTESGADGGSTKSGSGIPGVGDASAPLCTPDVKPPETRNVACTVTLSSPGLQEPASKHVPDGTAIAYCTNPPTSGPHSPIWADFKEYQAPVPWPNLVHSEEHGGVLLLYKCDPASDPSCAGIIDTLRQVAARAPVDATCESESRPGTKRIVIAPSPLIPTKVAAAAWGAFYTADCADGPTLDEFVATKGKKGPEDICFAGQSVF